MKSFLNLYSGIRQILKNAILRAFLKKVTRGHNRRVARLIRFHDLGSYPFDRDRLTAHISLWSAFSSRVNSNWYKLYSFLYGAEDERFVPLDLYYGVLEPRLNNYRFAKAFSEKNMTDLLLPDVRKPRVFLRYINGCFYDGQFRRLDNKGIGRVISGIDADAVLVKPTSDTRRGNSILKMMVRNQQLLNDRGRMVTMPFLADSYKRNFLVQEFINQHECTGRFNASSLNVIRVFTYRSVADDHILPLQISQKVGMPGNHVDHGGMIIGMNEKGKYNHYARSADRQKHEIVNGVDLKKLDPFPFIRELEEFCADVAGKFIHSRLLGLDLGVDRQGNIFLVEANTFGIGIDNLQYNNGPLFREYTEEVVDFCKDKKRTIAFFFDL